MKDVYVNDTFPKELAQNLREYAMTRETQGHFEGGYEIVEFWYDSDSLMRTAVEWTRQAFPALNGRKFQQGWFLLYDAECQGVGVHADPGSLNVNLWITPDDAILDWKKNGLIVYDKKRPDDWDWDDYNANGRKIRAFLRENQATSRTINYKHCRAILFDGRVFHKTNGVHTRKGAKHKRVNCTLVFE